MARGEVIKLVDDFIDCDIPCAEIFNDELNNSAIRSSIFTVLRRKNLQDIIKVTTRDKKIYLLNLSKMEE